MTVEGKSIRADVKFIQEGIKAGLDPKDVYMSHEIYTRWHYNFFLEVWNHHKDRLESN